MPQQPESEQPTPQEQGPFMPYPGYYYNYQDNEYIADIISNGVSPQFRTSLEKEAFVRRAMRKQEEFMAHLDVPGILEELNQELLGGKGEIALSYSNRGTSLLLQIDPSAGDNSPELLIGLVGDQNKFAAGEEDYMTNMAIMYLQERNAEALIQAYNDSTKAPNRLPIIVDPSLNPDRYTPEQWDKFHDITKERAAKILKEKLAEGPVMRPQGETSPTTVQHGWGFSHFDDFEYIKRIV